MDYKYVYNLFQKAVDNALTCIVENTYHSEWSELGCGWQEQWSISKEITNIAGIYASCEGLIALHEKQELMHDFYKRVYKYHLCQIFNENIPAQSPQNQRVRNRGLYTTYKLAHFLLASSYLKNPDIELMKHVLQRLVANYMPDKKMFAPSNKKEFGCILATSDALTALISACNIIQTDQEVIKSCIGRFTELFHSYNFKKQNEKIGEKAIILWTISNMPEYFESKVVKKAAINLIHLIEMIDGSKDKKVTVKFNISYLDNPNDNDYYNTNVHILLLETVVNYIQHKYIVPDYFSAILENLLFISNAMIEKGYYSTSDSGPVIEFWENFQAVQLLKHSCNLIEQNYYETGGNIMIVSPKIFNKTKFTQDAKLVTVIMPFNEEWSEDFYQACIEALEPKGYQVWQADLIKVDEIIMQKIWENINQSKFIIAECTGKNPNVFYELGIAHTIGKPVFMCAQNASDFPFDVSFIKHFVYNPAKYKSMTKLKEDMNEFANRTS